MTDCTAADWIAEFATRLGVDPPDAAERDELLDLAGIAAHGSERVAAPLSCWIAARAGVSPASALAIAREIASD